MSLRETLSDIQKQMAEHLLTRIKSGEATAAELNVARQLLKDNNIQAGTAHVQQPLMRLADSLPFPTEAEAV